MKILITGGAGFIGSHIADAYIKNGHKIIIIDNLKTGFSKNINPKAKFYKADIRNLAAMEKIFKKEKPEIVNHHAAIAEVVRSVKNPIPTIETNVIGTINILLSFGKYGRGKNKKIIFSSTGGAIYGNPKKIPASEKEEAAPLSPYGLSKLLGEEAIKFYCRQYKIKYLIFRYPNVYGPRQNPKGEAGIVAIFGWKMKKGIRPTIFGKGEKTRDYVYVEDIVRANITALKKGHNDILNLGFGKEVSDQMVFDAIAKQTGFSKKPIYANYRKGEVVRIAISPKKAEKILGWKAKVGLEDGIKKTIKSLT